MDLTLVKSNDYVNRECNYLVLISSHSYITNSNFCKNPKKSVEYGIKMIVWDLTRTIPVVCVLSSHVRWTVQYVCRFSILPHVDTIHVWIYDATVIFILGLLCINKIRDSFCHHRLFFSCDSNWTNFPFLVVCICDPLINVVFPVISLLHLIHFPTWKLFP